MYASALPRGTSAQALALRLASDPGLFWLDGDSRFGRGRWSFLGADPQQTLEVPYGESQPLAALAALEDLGDTPAAALDAPPPDHEAPSPGDVPHWVGYIAYEAYLDPERARWPGCQTRTNAAVLCFSRFLRSSLLRILNTSL